MRKEDYKNEQGKCPRCSKHQLRYDAIRYIDDMCWYPYKCENCGLEGEEWYRMSFAGHNIYDEKGEMIEL